MHAIWTREKDTGQAELGKFQLDPFITAKTAVVTRCLHSQATPVNSAALGLDAVLTGRGELVTRTVVQPHT
jgi:hypothetical protein